MGTRMGVCAWGISPCGVCAWGGGVQAGLCLGVSAGGVHAWGGVFAWGCVHGVCVHGVSVHGVYRHGVYRHGVCVYGVSACRAVPGECVGIHSWGVRGMCVCVCAGVYVQGMRVCRGVYACGCVCVAHMCMGSSCMGGVCLGGSVRMGGG